MPSVLTPSARRPQQRCGNQGLADTGVGAGNEKGDGIT